MTVRPSRFWLRFAALAVALLVLAALAYGLRIRVVGDPPRSDRVRVIDAPMPSASVSSPAVATASAASGTATLPSFGDSTANAPAPAPSSTEREPDIE